MGKDTSQVKRVLIFKFRSMPQPFVWDISNEKWRAKAYVDLFNCFDVEFEAFEHTDSVTLSLIGMARCGNADACEALLAWLKNKQDVAGSFYEIDVRNSRDDAPPEFSITVTEEMVEDIQNRIESKKR